MRVVFSLSGLRDAALHCSGPTLRSLQDKALPDGNSLREPACEIGVCSTVITGVIKASAFGRLQSFMLTLQYVTFHAELVPLCEVPDIVTSTLRRARKHIPIARRQLFSAVGCCYCLHGGDSDKTSHDNKIASRRSAMLLFGRILAQQVYYSYGSDRFTLEQFLQCL